MTASAKIKYVNCPQCSKKALWDTENPFRPFCSERCKMIDLGQWATEGYRIPVTEEPQFQGEDEK